MRTILPVSLLSLVALLPTAAAQEIPTPESVLGFAPGTDMKLADWPAMVRYFDALDTSSKRVAVERIGKTTLDKDMLLVMISSPRNLERQANIRARMERLGDPRRMPAAAVTGAIEDLPAVVFVGCAQHATEIGSTQMALSLAHHLATTDAPADLQILDQVVLLLVPSLNPDGHQMVCEWYAEHLGTPFEGGRMPWLYHPYVGHDINRDWGYNTQRETRAISNLLYEVWRPQLVIDVHQMGRSGARMFIPPYHDPVNPNIDPLIEYELSLIAAQMRLDLSAAGLKGVITSAMFDEWMLGYLSGVPCRHNMVAQLIEMASANLASPVFQRRDELRGSNGSEYARRANFVEPWEGGWWRLGDIVAYEQCALLSVLRLAARNREMFMRTFHRMADKQIEAGKNEPPFAYLFPPGQRDPATAWEAVDILRRGAVEVHTARNPFNADNIDYPAGTRVVLMEQPYRAHAKDLLEKQVYPNLRAYPGGPPDRPYDIAGWTMPLLMGVECVEVVEPFKADLLRLGNDDALPTGKVTGKGESVLLIDRGQNNAFILVNRLLAKGVKVQTLPEKLQALFQEAIPPGTFVIPYSEGLRDEIQALGLNAKASAALPEETKLQQVRSVRLGLYQPWTASMDEGWTRWVLERFEFPYTTVHDAEIRAGGLNARYDAILLADLRPSSILRGAAEGSMPKKYTGGIGEEGVFALRDFAREGGTLIALDSSCEFLIETLELPVKKVAQPDEESKRLFCPGSVLRLKLDPTHPLCWGMGATAAIMFASSPVFEKVESQGDDKGKQNGETPPVELAIPGTYPKVNPLLSGWLSGDKLLHGKGALVQAGFEEGKAVLIGFRCKYRAQTHGTFKILFNAILGAR